MSSGLPDVRIGVSLSTFAADPATTNVVDRAVELAAEAAQAGAGAVWFGQMFSYDAIGLAALVGREVPGLVVGTTVVPVVPRHPLLVASAAKTADAATGGRFELGVGLGGPALLEGAFGVRYPPAIRHLREWLEAAGPLLEGRAEAYDGDTVRSAPPMPTAVAGARTRPPLLVAAMGEQALRVTGRLADGTIPFLASPKVLRERIVPAITEAAEQAGRPRPRVLASVPVLVTDDPDSARAAAREALAFYDTIASYRKVVAAAGLDSAASLLVTGDEAEVADQLAEYVSAGATELTLTQADLLGEETRRRTWALAGRR